MPQFSLIAAVDENYGLGNNNQLLCHLPADLKHFKQITMGKPIIMGKKTYQSIGKPLPGRRNIVLTTQPGQIEGVELACSMQNALELVNESPEVMVIGGAVVFEQFLPLASQIYLTLIHHQFKADVYFPRLDHTVWHCIHSQYRTRDEKNLYDMTFYQYVRR
ncbi:dihydrofolate reductase FolA [Legionella beliardensis]|uniref:Dihydrofolate reductase n=1 Tax=Legionella beliardensis TaxID=91822 RepID=A0A378HYF6_9GAMM|nr:dihydrofolate reductase [Legionella beliardensis]STX27733.1 dihydrofolate reductase FolA [Legionella beliardensis]